MASVIVPTLSSPFLLTSAVPLSEVFGVASYGPSAENRVRVVFNHKPYFSNLKDIGDASDPAQYTIGIATKSPVGRDGLPAREVSVVDVELTSEEDAGSLYGYAVDVILDRPMSPAPANYTITFGMIWASEFYVGGVPAVLAWYYESFSATYLTLTGAVLRFDGVHAMLAEASIDPPIGKDIANPQDFGAIVDVLTTTPLAGFAIDDTGDVAFDAGFVSLKKRILRRLFTIKGAFAHLPDYGIGVQTYAGKLRTVATQARIISDIEKQVGEEPEVVAIKVRFYDVDGHPEMLMLKVFVKTRDGQDKFVSTPVAA